MGSRTLLSCLMAVVLLLSFMPIRTWTAAAEDLASSAAVGPLPVMKDIGWIPAEPAAGSPVTFQAVVENQGDTAVEGPLTVRFTIDGGATVLQAVYEGGIAPNQMVTVQTDQTWTAAPNHHKITGEITGTGSKAEKLLMLPAAELARGKPVAASTEKTGSGRTAAKANDGDPASQWESSAVPAHITVDLGERYDINKIAVSLGPDWTARTERFAVEGSLDGARFTELAPAKDYKFEKTPKHRHDITFATAQARYVRLVGASNSNAANGIQVTELEVYQDPTYKEPSLNVPRLSVNGFAWEPVNVFEGDTVTLKAIVENTGDGEYNGDLTVSFSDGTDVFTGTLPGTTLPKGWKTAVTSVPWTLKAPGGQRNVTVHAAGFESEARTYPVRILDASKRMPSEWTYTQVGTHGLPGAATYQNGAFTIESSGYDLAGTADEFVFVHQPVTGDTALSAKLVTFTAPDSNAGAGIMFRDSLEPDGSFVALRMNANRVLKLESRAAGGSVTSVNLGTMGAFPKYLKLVKTDQVYTAYVSDNGTAWGSPLGNVRNSLQGGVKGGMFAASRNKTQTGRAILEGVRWEPVTSPDLTVSRIVLNPAQPQPGDAVTFTADITNQGLTATQQSSFHVGFKVDPSVNAAFAGTASHQGTVQPGETVTVTGSAAWTALEGTHAVMAVIDPEGLLEESNKQNNAKTVYTAVHKTKPESELTAFEKRARYVVETFATEEPRQTDRTLWVKEAIFYAQARFELGTDVETALQWVDSINDNPAGASMFFYTSNIDTYLKYGHLYPAALREKVKQKLQAVDYSQNGSTENHLIKFRTAGYLVAQTWPDWSKAALTKQFAEQDLKSMMQRFVQYGMKEYDSTTYMALYVECLLMLHDLAEDPAMKGMARMTLDWLLANTAGEWVNGYWISSTLRDYEGMSPSLGAAGSIAAWLYLGGEELPRLLQNSVSYPEGFYAVVPALSPYRMPEILKRIAEDRSRPYVHLESHDQHPTNKLNNPYGYRKTSYITEHYGVASQFDGKGTLGWSDQLRRWFVRWESEHPYSTFFMTHPKRGGINSGATPYEQVLQKDGTILAVYDIPSGDPYPYVNGPFSSAILKLQEDPSGWIFGHGGSAMLAVKPLQPYSWTEESIGTLRIPVLRSAALKNGVIVETADPAAYRSAEDEGLSGPERLGKELQRFAEAVKTKTAVNASGLDSANPSFTYTSLAGDTLGIAYNGDRTVNGTAVDYTAWPLLGDPFMQQETGGHVLTLRHGGETAAYDFSRWTVGTPSAGPDLSVNQLDWTPASPKINDGVTFSATVRNVGQSAAAGGFEILYKVDGKTVGSSRHTEALEAGASETVVSAAWKPAEEKLYNAAAEVRLLSGEEENTSNNSLAKSVSVRGPVRTLFTDDFSADITSKWESAGSVGTWTHETDAAIGSKVMKGTSTATTGNPVRKVAKAAAWDAYEETNKDYEFVFKAKYNPGTASGGSGEQMRILTRFASSQAYYYFEVVGKTKTVSFVKYTAATGFVTLNQPVSILAALPGFDFNTYNEYAVKAEGGKFLLSINGQPVLETAEDTDIPAGSVGFMNRNSVLWIDEAEVRVKDAVENPVSPAEFEFRLAPGTPQENGEIAVDVAVKHADDLYGFVFDIAYDRTKLTLSKVEGLPAFGVNAYVGYQEHDGYVRVVGTRTAADGAAGITGAAELIRLTFSPVPDAGGELAFTLRSGSDYSDSQGLRLVVEEDVVAVLALARADVNGDGVIAINDLVLVAKAYGKISSDAGYKSAYDMNRDGVIDIMDLSFIALKLLEQRAL